MNKIRRFIFREYDVPSIFQEELNEQSVKLLGYYLGKKIGVQKVVNSQ